jgi:cell division protein FtsZ
MKDGGPAMMGTGVCDEDENRSIIAAERAISNPLLDRVSIGGASRVLINITGGMDMTLFEVDAAANRIREEINNPTANIIFGSTFKQELDGCIVVSVFATGLEVPALPVARIKEIEKKNGDILLEHASLSNQSQERNVQNILRPRDLEASNLGRSDVYEIPAFLRKMKNTES